MIRSLQGVRVLYNTYWVRFNHALFQHDIAVRNTLDLFDAAKQAGVERIVHISITNADAHSPLEYFRGKGQLEDALQDSGISYAIVRPAVLFGDEDILINNIAWALRRFPLFVMFGDGEYHIQPIFVDDLAALMVNLGQQRENALVQAIGPENFSYRELIRMIARHIGKETPVIGVPPWLGFGASWIIGRIMRDEFVTWPEIEGLMANTLHVPGATPTGTTRLSDWVRDHSATLGIHYHSELGRRRERSRAYEK
jgi:NADH dehydrogenase